MTDLGLLKSETKTPKKEQKEDGEGEKSKPYSFSISVDEPKRQVTGGAEVSYRVLLTNTGSKSDTIGTKLNVIFSAKMGEEAPEWPVSVEGAENDPDTGEYQMRITPGKSECFRVNVQVPHGVKYGDKVEVVLTSTSQSDSLVSEALTITTAAQQSFFAVKTALGQERDVVDAIANRAGRADVAVFAILSPAKVRGYVFVEAMNKDRLKEIVRGIKKARGMVDSDTPLLFDEICRYLAPKPLVSGIKEGDIVELVSGPFKGEKARVMQIDEDKEEVTVELFEAMVPIPVTIRGDSVRVLENEENM